MRGHGLGPKAAARVYGGRYAHRMAVLGWLCLLKHNRNSGETVRFRRLASGRVESVFVGSATLLRLDPVPKDGAVVAD